jgi:localization factor PodJL
VDSQYNLGRLYEEGIGVSQNAAEAYKWYLIAARSGDMESRSSAQRVRTRLSAATQSVVERTAAGFRPADAAEPSLATGAGAPVDSVAVVTAQRALSRLGYYQGPTDGSVSPALRMAVAAYQRDQNMPPTGALDDTTVSRLTVFTR